MCSWSPLLQIAHLSPDPGPLSSEQTALPTAHSTPARQYYCALPPRSASVLLWPSVATAAPAEPESQGARSFLRRPRLSSTRSTRQLLIRLYLQPRIPVPCSSSRPSSLFLISVRSAYTQRRHHLEKPLSYITTDTCPEPVVASDYTSGPFFVGRRLLL